MATPNKTLLWIVLCIFCISTQAQDAKSGRGSLYWSQLKYDSVSILKSMGHAYSRPAQWKGDDWLTFGAVITSGLIMYQIDGEASDFFTNQEASAPQMLKEIGWYYGSPQNFFMLSAGLYGYGLFAQKEAVRHTGVLIIASAATTGIVQTILKNGIGRARPSQEVGPYKYKPFSRESGYHALPSGHSILSFVASHAIAKQVNSIGLKGLIYGVGLIAPVSRLWAGAHWLTDVTLGMVLSIAVVDSIDKFLKQERTGKGPGERTIQWNLQLKSNGIGLVGLF